MAAIPIQTSTFPYIGVMSFPEGLSYQIKNPVFGVLRIPPLQLFGQGCPTEHPLKGIQTVACTYLLPLTYLLEFDRKTPLPKKPYTLIVGCGEIKLVPARKLPPSWLVFMVSDSCHGGCWDWGLISRRTQL